MRKTLSVLVAAVVALTFFATTAFAATTASLGANTTDGVIVQASSDLAKLFDGEKWEDLGRLGRRCQLYQCCRFREQQLQTEF